MGEVRLKNEYAFRNPRRENVAGQRVGALSAIDALDVADRVLGNAAHCHRGIGGAVQSDQDRGRLVLVARYVVAGAAIQRIAAATRLDEVVAATGRDQVVSEPGGDPKALDAGEVDRVVGTVRGPARAGRRIAVGHDGGGEARIVDDQRIEAAGVGARVDGIVPAADRDGVGPRRTRPDDVVARIVKDAPRRRPRDVGRPKVRAPASAQCRYCWTRP